jgi:hypothetical protein
LSGLNGNLDMLMASAILPATGLQCRGRNYGRRSDRNLWHYDIIRSNQPLSISKLVQLRVPGGCLQVVTLVSISRRIGGSVWRTRVTEMRVGIFDSETRLEDWVCCRIEDILSKWSVQRWGTSRDSRFTNDMSTNLPRSQSASADRRSGSPQLSIAYRQ